MIGLWRALGLALLVGACDPGADERTVTSWSPALDAAGSVDVGGDVDASQ